MARVSALPPQRSVVSGADAFFRHLSQDTARKLGRLGTAMHAFEGLSAPLARQGESVETVFIILRGAAKVTTVSDDGRDVLVTVYGPNDLVGVASSLFDPPRWRHTVTPVGVLTAKAIPLGHFHQLTESNSEVRWAVTHYVAHLLNASDQRFADISTMTAGARVRRLLLDLAHKFGKPPAEDRSVEIAVALSQHDLASLVGVSEISLHRELTKLRHAGLVEVGYRSLTLLDPVTLASPDGPD